MNWDTLGPMIGGLLAGGGGAGSIFYVRSRQRLYAASAGDRISMAAARLVEQTGDLLPNLTAQMARMEAQQRTDRTEIEQQRAEIRVLRDELELDRAETATLRAWIDDHAAWDEKALAAIEAAGVHIDAPAPPPPLKARAA